MRRRLGIGLVVVTALALAAGLYFGGFHALWDDATAVAALMERAGPSAPVAFVLLFALLNAFGFPGLLLVGAAVMTWSLPTACLLSWVGGVGAGLVACGCAQLVGRDWVEARLPARLRAYDQHLAARPVRTVVLIRLVFFLNPLSHWFLALSRVPVAALVLGSAIGLLPGMVFASVAGVSALDWMVGQPVWVWVVLAAAGVAGVMLYRARARARLATLVADA